MKKSMTVIVLFAVLLVFVSAYTGRVYEAAEGYKAPAVTLTNSESATASLADLKGRYVLLSFWASSDAASRVDAARYDAFARRASEERFCLLSVNMDRSERLFREIVRRDNLSAQTQYRMSDSESARVAEQYSLSDNGFNSYLIDPEGKVIAMNPTDQTLTQVLSQQ